MFKEFGIKSRMLTLTLLPGCLLAIMVGCIAPQLFTPANLQQNYPILCLALLAFALSGLVAWRLGRSLQTQTAQLRQGIAMLQHGQPDNPMHRLQSRELNQLAEAINQLGITLHNQRDNLQRRLTQSLEDSRQHQQTAEVQRIELDMARTQTRAASRTRSGFLANMSHEIRTPLNGILGFSQLLHKTALNTQQRAHLQTIQSSAENLLGMLNQALDSSRFETDSLRLDSQPFDLRELIHGCLSVVALAAHEKQLELVAMVYRDTPQTLLGDPALLKQILIHLLGNAIRLATRDTIVIRAMLEDDCSEFARLRISVQYSDAGLAADELREVFQALEQTDNSATQRSAGSATGLVIARRLAELMGGVIGMESTPDAGAELWICISLAKTAVLPEPAASVLPGQRIGIFEPHDLARQSLLNQLQDYGLEVLNFEHLDELLQAVAEQQHDTRPITLAVLGISDIDMPAEQLRLHLQTLQQHNCKSLVLCPTTAQAQLYAITAFEGCQLQSKPAYGRRLVRALEELLDPRAAASESLQQPLLADDQTAPLVLCVDDNPANLLLVQSLLIDIGARVTAVDSGQAALDAADQQQFDLILMDIRMPGMDGLQASMAIRQREQQQQRLAVPIIALTAHVLPNQKRSLLQAGMNDLLSKPINQAQLARVLHKWSAEKLRKATAPTAMPSTDALPILDHHEALRLAGGKLELANDLLAMLLGSLDEEQQAIARARASNNAGDLADRVHRLLGASRYCGVPQLREACQRCENLLRRGDTHTGPALDQLDLAISRLQRESLGRRIEISV